MSIVACVKVYDGIVLGADSATNIIGSLQGAPATVIKTYQNARKIFQAQELPIGILSYGIGNIGKKSLETLLRDFDQDHYHKDGISVRDFAQELLDFFKEKYNVVFGEAPVANKPVLGFYVAGYSPGKTLGEEYEFLLPRDEEQPIGVRSDDIFGASWRGVSLPFTRLYFGMDPNLKDEIVKAGFDAELLDKLSQPFMSQVIFDGMPLQDAVRFTEFILRTTIDMAQFVIGAPSCSEPIDVAVINSEKHFVWVSQKKLSL